MLLCHNCQLNTPHSNNLSKKLFCCWAGCFFPYSSYIITTPYLLIHGLGLLGLHLLGLHLLGLHLLGLHLLRHLSRVASLGQRGDTLILRSKLRGLCNGQWLWSTSDRGLLHDGLLGVLDWNRLGILDLLLDDGLLDVLLLDDGLLDNWLLDELLLDNGLLDNRLLDNLLDGLLDLKYELLNGFT